jgi:hypothetical protein
MDMSLQPMKQVRTAEKPLMDLQLAATLAVTQLQAQAVAEAKLLVVALPTLAGKDIVLAHNFGRPLKGYFIGRISYATWQGLGMPVTLYDSQTANPTPDVFAIVQCNAASPVGGQALTISVLVF